MPRMRILSASEQAAFDSPPLFNHEQRKQYFAFPNVLLDTAKTLRTPTSQVGFLLLCGYFKATKRFFPPQDFWQRDIEAVARELDLEGTAFNPKEYTETTRLRQQKAILEFYGFQVFDSRSEALLGVEISAMARLHLQPRLIFDRCIDFLLQKRIQVPKAGTLAELIRLGLNQRKTKWVKLMEAHLTDQARRLLDGLFTQPDNQNQYRLTLLKKLSQSTRPSRVREAIADFKTLAGIYRPLEGILATLALGHAGIRYFAGSVMKSEIFQIQRREANDRYIHAAAFVAHQFFRLQDNLTDLFLNVMASFQTAAIREHKDRLFEQRKAQNQQLKTVIGELDASVFGLLREIRHLTDDGALSDTQKVEQIRLLLTQGKTESFEQLKEGLKQAEQAQDGHDILEQQSLRLQSRLSPILKALDFEPITPANPLAEAIRHFKSQDGAITDKTPTGFLDEEERAALVREDGTFRPSLYKVFLFRHVAEAIKSGSLNLSQSYKYRPLDSYLIDQKRWQQDKQALLEQAGLTEFMDPEPVLKALEAALFRQYQDTNAAIGGNPHLHFRVDGSFYVHTPALDARETDPLQELFPRQHDVPLAQVLGTINRHCGMLGAFVPLATGPYLTGGVTASLASGHHGAGLRDRRPQDGADFRTPDGI